MSRQTAVHPFAQLFCLVYPTRHCKAIVSSSFFFCQDTLNMELCVNYYALGVLAGVLLNFEKRARLAVSALFSVFVKLS